MSLRVLDPGLYALVVDFGRPRTRSLGVPVGGAADRTSLTLGNALVGNPPDAAALEFSLTGPTLQATCELACVVYGAPFEIRSDRQKLVVGKTFTLQPGEILQILSTAGGMRAYLCVRSGLQVAESLGSRSSLAPVRPGDELPCLPGQNRPRFFLKLFDWEKLRYPPWEDDIKLRALRGPQANWLPSDTRFFSDREWGGAWNPTFVVSRASNRMGLRLEGPPLPVPNSELVSEPVCPGAVQLTRDGQCIILGMDGQTIGGYPKVAHVIRADLDLIGQLRPGDAFRFVEVSLDEAEQLHGEKEAELTAWATRLRAAASAS